MKDLMWATLFHLGRNFCGDSVAFKKGDNLAACFGFKQMDFDVPSGAKLRNAWRRAA